MRTRSLSVLIVLLVFSALWAAPAWADWRKSYPELRIAVITTESETELMNRWKPFTDYLAERLKVKVSRPQAADYAGVIEAMKGKKLELGFFGPTSYAQACWS